MKTYLFNLWNKHQEKTLILQDQAIVSASNFVIGILISKFLGLTELGVYALLWMLLMICSSLFQNFIQIPMVNEYTERKGTSGTVYLNSLFFLQISLSVLISIVCCIAIFTFTDLAFFRSLAGLEWIAPMLIFSFLMHDFMRRVYVLKNQLYKLLIVDFMVNAAQIVYLLLIINDHTTSLSSILIFFSYTYLLGFVAGGINYILQFNLKRDLVKIFRKHLEMAAWLLATACLQWFAGNYFILSATNQLDTDSIGVIRIVQSLVGVLNVLFIALEFYIPQKVAILYRESGVQSMLKYILYLSIVGIILCSIFSCIVIIWGNQLLLILYGHDYVQYHTTLTLFSFFYILVFIGYPLRFALRALDNTKNMFIAYVIAVIFSLSCADLIIQQWKINGIIAGLAITQILMQAWYIISIIRSVKKLPL